jgi:predicted XRE-type DNA-binding protein
MKNNEQVTVQEGCGNVFTGLGLPSPEEDQIKSGLMLQIYRIIRQRNLTQAEAGKVLGVKQPRVSALMRNRSGNVSVGQFRSSALE